MPMLLPCKEMITTGGSRHPCGELSAESRCPGHRRAYEQRRIESEPWRLFYKDPRWFVTTRKVKARDGQQCTYQVGTRKCISEGPLSVHHEKKLRHIWRDCGKPQPGSAGWERFVKFAIDVRKLRTLCERHHKLVDNTNPERNWVGVPPVQAGSQDRRQRQAHKRASRRRQRRKPIDGERKGK